MHLDKFAYCGVPARGCFETIVNLFALMVPPFLLTICAVILVILALIGGDLFLAVRLFGGS